MMNVTAIKWNGLAIQAQYRTSEEALDAIRRWQTDRFDNEGHPLLAAFIVDSESGTVAWDYRRPLVRFNLLGGATEKVS